MKIESFPIVLDQNFFIVLTLHTIISILISLGVAYYIKKRFVTTGFEKEDLHRLQMMTNKTRFHRLLFHASLHRHNFKSSFNYFVIFNFSMPLLGYIASLWFAWHLVHVKYEKKAISSGMINLDEFTISFIEVKRIFGEGSFNNLINNKYVPTQKKIYALGILASNLSPANLKIIKQTLSSPEDEVRMFGYATINKAEQKLARSINAQLAKYQEAKNEEEKASSAYELAFLYWEMLYTELSDEILAQEFMQEVQRYLQVAIPLFTQQLDSEHLNKTNDTLFKLSRLHQLYGRYYMKKEEYEYAVAEFTIAQQLSEENATFTLPYMAEAYFNLGKYDIVHSVLNQLSLLEINATIYPIIEQWKRKVA